MLCGFDPHVLLKVRVKPDEICTKVRVKPDRERWQSGLLHQVANLEGAERSPTGSNPVLSSDIGQLP